MGICALYFFFFNDTATTEIYTLSHTTLFRSPHGIVPRDGGVGPAAAGGPPVGPARARAGRDPHDGARGSARARRALAQLPRQVPRGESDAQEDAGAVRPVPRPRGSAGGAPRHRPRPVQRRLLARRVRWPLPATPEVGDLAESGPGRTRAAPR